MYNVAIIGSTGAVGREIVGMLEKRKFPVKELFMLASERSEGQELLFKKKKIKVINIDKFEIKNIDFAFFSAGSEISKKWAKKFADSGTVVIDNTSLFRMEKKIPLIVPEVNGEKIRKMKSGIIANPNCSTIQMVLALHKIEEMFGLKKIVVSTYQSVSGTGQKGIQELENETYKENDTNKKVYPRQIAFNVIPQIDDFVENGFTKEEMKMVNETKKILGKKKIEINATCVRVPVMRGHSESIYIETEKKIKLNELLVKWAETPNLVIREEQKEFPTPKETEKEVETFVGRIRKDLDNNKAMSFWVVSDNLLKGAAFNSVQIAEEIVKYRKNNK
jgi:aspartate-semialdehyde dehydrogenase